MTRRARFLLAIAAVLAGCAERSTPPHGGTVARATLSRDGFAWRTHEGKGVHLHYLADGHAAAHAPELARAAETALAHDLALGGFPPPREPVELFLVDSRGQAERLTGNGYMGQAIPGELTAFFVAKPGPVLAFRHEIMHALSLKLWGTRRTGSWLADGVATWAGGTCQGHGVDAVATGFLRDGTLPPLRELAARFWEIGELRAYLTAGSVVAFVARRGGSRGVQALWNAETAPGAHPLGPGGDEVEAAWRRHLATIPPARIDTTRLRREGCAAP